MVSILFLTSLLNVVKLVVSTRALNCMERLVSNINLLLHSASTDLHGVGYTLK